MDRPPTSSVPPPKQKPKKISKAARLVVRNLSFQVTEEKFREHFSSCGEIKDLNILKKPNGKMVGCAFIQYARVPEAAKAIRELNLKQFMGRPIAIDWALSKEKFQGKQATEVKPEVDDVKPDSDDLNGIQIKEEVIDEYEDVKPFDELDTGVKRERSDDDSASDSDGSSESSETLHAAKRRKVVNDDADEGRTLFLRNLEFETTPEKLKEFFEAFGPLCYAVLCKDRLTEHPKGTAFVKFKSSEDLEACIGKYEREPTSFIIGKRHLVVSEALSKNKLDQRLQVAATVKKDPKDKRNLFLAREGFIRPETEAVEGMSLHDINKRAELHRVKRQMLKDLSIFVSDVRICVHNLPQEFTDKNLRKLFVRYGGKRAHLTEAKVMRDMKDLDINGVGKSRGFGFVTFTKHENALHALRAINNNPGIFSPKKRPIVEFSLENRKAIQAKEKRAARSKELNKNGKKLRLGSKDEATSAENKGKRKNKLFVEAGVSRSGVTKLHQKRESHEEQELPKYSGLTAKFGISSLPSMKAKGKITRNSLKPLKHKKKGRQERRMREPKSRPLVKKSVDQVDKLVSRYKQRTVIEQKPPTAEKKQKKKWFK